MAKKLSFTYFRMFNLWMGLLHAVQALLMLFLAKEYALPVTISYLSFSPQTKQLEPATEVLFEMPLVWLLVIFLVLSSFAHLIIATVYRKSYEANLKKGINKARWVEYAISASIMMVAIALLVGVYDLSSLIMIFSLVAIMNLMGLVMELWNQNSKHVNWVGYWIGSFAGIIPWVVVGVYFIGAASFGTGNIPTFVYWIYATIFLFFMSFAVNMALQYARVGKWSNYLYGERMYIILSLTAKSALAWQVFAGTLRP